MDVQTKADLVTAVNLLIRSPQAQALYQTMIDTAPMLARHPELCLTGPAEDLNVLARYKISHPDIYESIIGLVEQKRAAAGVGPLATPTDVGFDKAMYMQQFMEAKRVRQRRAADIENLQRNDRDKLVGRARLDFMQRQSALWKAERDQMLMRAKQASPQRIKREALTALLENFWSKIDARLDALETAARSGRYVGRDTTSLADLDAVLRHDPYKE